MKECLCFFLAIVLFADPLLGKETWDSFKKSTLVTMSSISGWCSEEKAVLMMDLIKKDKCSLCVEIGVLAGKSLFPIAQALQYNTSGKVFAIDAWNPNEALRGMSSGTPQYDWWKSLDYNGLYKNAVKVIEENKLQKYCTIIRRPSKEAVNLFKDGTIDFIHFDGNHSEEGVSFDMKAYFPKVKDGGYILLNDPNWINMRQALVFLLERATLVSPFSQSATYLLFRKDSQRICNANKLTHQ